MSDYIQIPNSITTKLTKRSKHEEAFVYATIRSQIKDSSLHASYPQSSLVDFFIQDEKTISDEKRLYKERTINNYVAELKKDGLLEVTERKQGESEYPYNVYKFEELAEDYFMILPPFLHDNDISPKLKGLLLFIKANCWSGTNYLLFNGMTTDLAEKLGVGKNQIKGYLEELNSKGYIRFIGKSIHIINENFPLFYINDMDNMTYQIIYDYCLEHDSIPPIKNVDSKGKDKALRLIVGKFTNDYESLRNVLEERCQKLPEHPSLEYFCQVLVNRKPTKEDKACKPDILL
jgi:hypothetical protein